MSQASQTLGVEPMLTKSWPFRPRPRKYSPWQGEKYRASVTFWRNNLQLPEFTRSATLRWTLLVAGIFAAFVVVLLEFVYLKTKNDLTMRSDRLVASQIGVFADLSPERRLDAINEHLKQDPARVRLPGLSCSTVP